MISLRSLGSQINALKALAIAAMALSVFGFGGAQAQTVTGTATPASTTPSQPVTVSLAYSGFTVQNIGYQFRVYFDSTQLTFVSATNGAAPVGAYQGDSGALADGANGDGVAATNSYVELVWADFGNSAWPTAAAGTLGTVSFTTTAAFAGTSVSLRESASGARVRGVPGTAVPIGFTAPPAPTVSVAASLAALNDSAGNVSTLTFTASAAAPAGGFSVAITPPAASGRYTTSCASPITIAAGQTQATCSVTATPNTVPGDGSVTATTTVLAGTGYAVGSPPSASVSINDDDVAPSVSVAATPPTLSNGTGGSSTYTFTASAVAPVGGLSVTFTPPAASALYTTTCVSPIVIAATTTTRTCTVTAVTPATTNATATATVTITGGSAATYSIGTPSAASVVVTSAVPTVTVSASPTSLANAAGNVSTVTFTASSAAPAGGLSVPFTPPATSAFYTTTCVSPIVIAAGTLTATCTITAAPTKPTTGGSAVATATLLAGPGFIIGTQGSASVQVGFVPPEPLVAVPTMSAVSLGLMSLLIFGFVAFGQRRRANK